MVCTRYMGPATCRILRRIRKQIEEVKEHVLAETRDAARRERLRTVQDLDRMLTQRGAVHALPHSSHRVADGTAGIGLPAAAEPQLNGSGKGARRHVEQPPAETSIDACLPLSETGGRHQLLPPPSLSLQLARLQSHAAAGSELAADTQPSSARSRQSSRARRAVQPQANDQELQAHSEVGLQLHHVVLLLPSLLQLTRLTAEVNQICRMCSLRVAM